MIKILVDRAKPTSEEINNRQNFESILKEATHNETKKVIPWYYGVVGLASFLVAILTILL
jgi:hypothetical protein